MKQNAMNEMVKIEDLVELPDRKVKPSTNELILVALNEIIKLLSKGV